MKYTGMKSIDIALLPKEILCRYIIDSYDALINLWNEQFEGTLEELESYTAHLEVNKSAMQAIYKNELWNELDQSDYGKRIDFINRHIEIFEEVVYGK